MQLPVLTGAQVAAFECARHFTALGCPEPTLDQIADEIERALDNESVGRVDAKIFTHCQYAYAIFVNRGILARGIDEILRRAGRPSIFKRMKAA